MSHRMSTSGWRAEDQLGTILPLGVSADPTRIFRMPEDQVVKRGTTVQLECRVKHDPSLKLTVSWLKDDEPLYIGNRSARLLTSWLCWLLSLGRGDARRAGWLGAPSPSSPCLHVPLLSSRGQGWLQPTVTMVVRWVSALIALGMLSLAFPASSSQTQTQVVWGEGPGADGIYVSPQMVLLCGQSPSTGVLRSASCFWRPSGFFQGCTLRAHEGTWHSVSQSACIWVPLSLCARPA